MHSNSGFPFSFSNIPFLWGRPQTGSAAHPRLPGKRLPRGRESAASARTSRSRSRQQRRRRCACAQAESRAVRRAAGAGRRPGGAVIRCAGRRPQLRRAVPGSPSPAPQTTMVLESVVADLLNRFLGDYVENLNKSQLKLGIWGGKREGVAAGCLGLSALAEGPTPRAAPFLAAARAVYSLRRPRLRLRGGRWAGPPPWAAGAGRGEVCAGLRRHGVSARAARIPRFRDPEVEALAPSHLLTLGGLSLPSAWPLWPRSIKNPSLHPAWSEDGCVASHVQSGTKEEEKRNCVLQ